MGFSKITSWSFSRLKQYEKCPFAAKCKFVDKMKEPGNAAMARGNDIHKEAEDYTKGLIKKLPASLAKFKEEFAELKKSNPIVEESWAFTKQWTKTVWNDWAGCWLRIKVDAACIDKKDLYVIDHKTGREYGDHADQLELYGVGGLVLYPNIDVVYPQLWYLDSGNVVNGEPVHRNDLTELKLGWDKRVKPMLNDTRFAPNPGSHCQWCAFSKSKGGPCKFAIIMSIGCALAKTFYT